MTWLYVPCISAPDTTDGNSHSESPDVTYEPYVTLSGKATRRPTSWPAWQNRPWIKHLYGTLQIDTLIAHGMPPNEVVIFAAREWGWTLRGAAQVVAKRARTRR
jgi:hypothetical protein